MTDQGTNKTGFARDNELKRELQGALKANPALRAQEEFEPDASGGDQPVAEPGGPAGAPPAGMTPRDVAFRNELARHLDRSIFPARRSALLGALHRHQAPDALVERVASLPPDEEYPNVQAVVRALGLGVESPRG